VAKRQRVGRSIPDASQNQSQNQIPVLFDTWARAELARRRDERNSELISSLKDATNKQQIAQTAVGACQSQIAEQSCRAYVEC
jgi:hypothetical protein